MRCCPRRGVYCELSQDCDDVMTSVCEQAWQLYTLVLKGGPEGVCSYALIDGIFVTADFLQMLHSSILPLC